MHPLGGVEAPALLTDTYQLTMMQSYIESRMNGTAVFEFFVRALPPNRSFLVAAGLEQAIQYLEELRFSAEEIAWLSKTGLFSRRFLEALSAFRFSGDVDAMEEGTPFFANEPILRVVAPIAQAQLVESRLINLLHLETLIASKAARCVLAGAGKLLVDFGMRRAHGEEAALLAARASYLAGFSGSSLALAGPLFGIPIFGTMAHSFIEAHETEERAFLSFAETQFHARGAGVTLLLDTYDTENAARTLGRLAPELARRGLMPRAVRLDSGDLLAHSRQVRAILDGAGLRRVRIFVSGGLDEQDVARLLGSGAPIDGFGIGTHLTTSSDQPYLDCAYKLQEYNGIPRRKTSEGKASWPGRKQVFRSSDSEGRYEQDTLAIIGEELPGEPLLRPILRSGLRVGTTATLETARGLFQRELGRLPPSLKSLERAEPYPVLLSARLRELARECDARRAA